MKREVRSPAKMTYKLSKEQSTVGPQEIIMSQASIPSMDKINSFKKTSSRIMSEREDQQREIQSPQKSRSPSKQGLVEVQQSFANGDSYRGSALNGLAEGFGVYTFKNQGVQYRGYFNGGVMHGNGVLIGLPSGQQREWLIYDGQWQRGQKSGLGKYYYFQNEVFYDGNWQKNKKQGHGTFKSPNLQYVGEWRDDMKHGTGVVTQGSQIRYQGVWGVYFYQNGDRYEGDFDNFIPHGYGIYTEANQNVYRGEFVKGKKQGNGQMVYKNGESYRGPMRDNLRQGRQGVYRWPKGEQMTAVFADNEPISGRINIPQQGQFRFELSKNFN